MTLTYAVVVGLCVLASWRLNKHYARRYAEPATTERVKAIGNLPPTTHSANSAR